MSAIGRMQTWLLTTQSGPYKTYIGKIENGEELRFWKKKEEVQRRNPHRSLQAEPRDEVEVQRAKRSVDFRRYFTCGMCLLFPVS